MQFKTTTFKNFKSLFYLFFVTVLIASCGTYRSVNNDGIYASEERDPRIIVAGSEEHRDHEKNYFTSEVRRLDLINGTDIDGYSSYSEDEGGVIVESDSIDYRPNGNSWGSNNTTTLIVVDNGISDLQNYWLAWDYWRFGFGYYNTFNPWFYGRPWRYNYGVFGPYGFYGGFYGGVYNPYYCPPYYGGWYGVNRYNNYYYRNYRRDGYAANTRYNRTNTRRNFVTNTRRAVSNNRRVATNRRTSSIRRNHTVRTRTNNVRSSEPRVRSIPKRRTTRVRSSSSARTRTRSSSVRSRSYSPSRTRSSSVRSRSSSPSRGGFSSRGSSRKRG